MAVICLDAQKAFDVVDHDILRLKVHKAGITGKLWLLIDDLHCGVSESVRWKGAHSRTYKVSQGVRQGGILSTWLYKLYVNDLLQQLQASGIGHHIGPEYVGCPTVADDVLLLANNHFQIQAMLTMCDQYATSNKYTIHPTKSMVTYHTKPKTALEKSYPLDQCFLGTDPITHSDTFTHLGQEWAAGRKAPDIDKHIKTARNTAYALMNSGLHGENGLNPRISKSIISSHVVPRLLYGLEATCLLKREIKALESFHKDLLRRVQGLNDRVATEAVYLLLGEIPIEATLHMRSLGLYGMIARLGDHALRRIALRQMALHDQKSTSWFGYIAGLGELYGIDVHAILTTPWEKDTWRLHVNRTVTLHWHYKLITSALNKSTLKLLTLETLSPGQCHTIWQTCPPNMFQVKAAMTRAKILTGTYDLQIRRAKFNQHNTDPTCTLCQATTEDTAHFILHCQALASTREPYINRISLLLLDHGHTLPASDDEWCKLVVGGSLPANSILSNAHHRCHSIRSQRSQFKQCNICSCIRNDINELCNSLCSHLNKNRQHIMNTLL